MSTCQAGRIGHAADVGDWDNPKWARCYDRCGDPVSHRISSGCVHEHVMTWDICAGCAAVMDGQIASGVGKGCVACRPLHGKCPVIVSIRELEPAS